MTAAIPANPSVLPGAGDLVVSGPADVLAVAPGFVQQAQGSPAPVRDALVAALDGLHEKYQEQAGYAAAQCDILRATDQYLVGLAEDRGYFPQPGEAQEAFRARVVGAPAQVTPAAIIAVINAILAPFTSIQCEYFESSLDRMFLTDGTAPFHAFWLGLPGASPGDASPQYTDRLYRDDALPGGANAVSVPNRDPGGAWVFGDDFGRYFVVRVPAIKDTATSLIYSGLSQTTITDALIFSGQATLNTIGHDFQPSDAGKAITVVGAGPAGGNLVTSILAFNTSTQVVLAANASTTVGPTNAIFASFIMQGPNDTAPPELGGAEAGAQENNGTVIAEPVATGGNLATTAGGRGFFVGDGSNTSGAEADGSVALFLFNGAQSAAATYQSMVNAVERIKGQSIRWMLVTDPNLVN